MGEYPTYFWTIVIAFIAPIVVLVAQHYLKRVLPGLAKLEVHLSDRLLLSFNDRGHTLLLYGSIYSKFGNSFVKKMEVTLSPEDSSEHFEFQLDSISLDLTGPQVPPVAFPVVERGAILLVNFKNEKTFLNLATFKSEWYREMHTYSKQFPNGFDSTDFQTSYQSQEATKDFVNKIQEIFFWKDGKYKLKLKVDKGGKKPKIWIYEFTLSFDDKTAMKKNAELIATIYPSSYSSRAPLFYNAYCALKEVSEKK